MDHPVHTHTHTRTRVSTYSLILASFQKITSFPSMLERFMDITRSFLLSTSDNPAKRFLAISLPAAGWIFRIDRSVFRVPRRSPGWFAEILRKKNRRSNVHERGVAWKSRQAILAENTTLFARRFLLEITGASGIRESKREPDSALVNGGAVSQETGLPPGALCAPRYASLIFRSPGFASAIVSDHLRRLSLVSSVRICYKLSSEKLAN